MKEGSILAVRLMGIEIGNTHIKILEVVKSGAKIEVKKFSLLKTPPDCILDGVISQIDPIKKVISKELKAKRYRSKKVVAVVQSSHIIIRNVIMEKQPEKIIKQFIQMKIESFLPIESEQYQIDFRVLEELEEEGQIKNKLMLVAAPKRVILPLASLLRSLKLRPLSITIPSEALQSIFHLSMGMSQEVVDTILVIDMGGKSTTVTIITEDGTYLTRMIPFEIEKLDEKNDQKEDYFTKVIRPQLEYNIISEIERILQFYYSSEGKGAISKIYLIGGGANMKGIKSYIRDAFNIPVESMEFSESVTEIPDIGFKQDISFFANVLGAVHML